MKQVIKGISIAAVALFMAGCDEVKFNGLLNVSEPLAFKQDLKAFTPEENYRGPAVVTVAPGQFQAKATIGKSGSKKQIKLEIANGEKPTVVKIQFSKDIPLGSEFTLAAAQIGQSFDMVGRMDTKVEKSPEYSGYEHCTYQYPQTVCRSAAKSANEEAASKTLESDLSAFAKASDSEDRAPGVPNPTLVPGHYPPGQFNNPPPPHTPVCHTVWIDRPGTMYVRYYHETTLRDLSADFVQGGKTLANYSGKSSETRTVYTHQSACH